MVKIYFLCLPVETRERFFMQENTLSTKFVGLEERSPKKVLNFSSDKVRG
jgi:hypothetical protein